MRPKISRHAHFAKHSGAGVRVHKYLCGGWAEDSRGARSRFLLPVYRRNHRRFLGSSPTRQLLTARYFRNSGHRQPLVRFVALREATLDMSRLSRLFSYFYRVARVCLLKYKRDRSVDLITSRLELESGPRRREQNCFSPELIISRTAEIK